MRTHYGQIESCNTAEMVWFPLALCSVIILTTFKINYLQSLGWCLSAMSVQYGFTTLTGLNQCQDCIWKLCI